MKKVMIFGFLTLGTMSMISCKKCHDCHYDTTAGEVEIGELCGDELENAEANGYAVGDTIYTVHCHEH